MDRSLVNNQIVLMRKTVRNVKRFVYQKMVKRIKRLEFRKTKLENKDLLKKLENKIINKKKDLVSIKGVNVDQLSKQALVQTKTHFQDILKNSQSTAEAKALARIALNESIGKAVDKFKDENPNCDQWLSSQIELWEQKKAIKRNWISQKKGLNIEENKEISVQSAQDNENDSNTSNSSKPIPPKPEKKKKESKLKTRDQKNVSQIQTNVVSNTEEVVNEELNETNKPKADPFFLIDGIDSTEEQSDNNNERNERKLIQKNKNKRILNTKPIKEKKSKFPKRMEKSGSDSRNTNVVTKRVEDNEKSRQNSKAHVNSKAKTGSGQSGQSLHPSWAAKQSIKNKFKIDLNQKPLAKKIKF